MKKRRSRKKRVKAVADRVGDGALYDLNDAGDCRAYIHIFTSNEVITLDCDPWELCDDEALYLACTLFVTLDSRELAETLH